MTFKELSQLYWLNREIERDKARLDELRTKSVYTEQGITGVPGTRGVSNRTSNYAAEIADMREVIEINIRRCFYELDRLNRYINTVEDARLRAILSLRFINGLTWWQVAASIGGRNTASGVRMACERHLKKTDKK
jgi:hypothetical protein